MIHRSCNALLGSCPQRALGRRISRPPMTRDQRRSGEFRVFSWATVKEAVAHVKTAQKETIAEKSPRASRSRTVQSDRPEQPFVRKRSADLRPCHNRVCRLVLLGTASRLQPHRSLRYRIYLEQQYAPTTINLRLAAVRRVAFEAADSGLLSPELPAGIRRVKGVMAE